MPLKDKILTWLSSAIYWEIILIPFVASFSSAAVNAFIGLLLASFTIKEILRRKTCIFSNPLAIPFGILILVSLFSMRNSVNITSSFQGIIKLIKYGSLLFVLYCEIKDKEHIKKIIAASMFGLLLASLDGVYQLIFGVDFFRHKPYDSVIGLPRLKAAFPHTNIFAGYLALFVPLSAVLFLYYLKSAKKIISGIICFLGLFCLVFTFSRSAVFGVWLALLIYGLVKKNWLFSAVLILVVLIAPFFAPQGIRDWTKSTGSVAELLLNKERFALYETSFNMIKHHPVIGVGVNTYCLNYQKYKLHDTTQDTADTMWYAHNSYLQMASETGLAGFFVFLYLLFKLVKGSKKFFAGQNDKLLRITAVGLLMGIFAFLVHGLTETNLYYPKIAVLFWFQVALLGRIIFTSGDTAAGGINLKRKA